MRPENWDGGASDADEDSNLSSMDGYYGQYETDEEYEDEDGDSVYLNDYHIGEFEDSPDDSFANTTGFSEPDLYAQEFAHPPDDSFASTTRSSQADFYAQNDENNASFDLGTPDGFGTPNELIMAQFPNIPNRIKNRSEERIDESSVLSNDTSSEQIIDKSIFGKDIIIKSKENGERIVKKAPGQHSRAPSIILPTSPEPKVIFAPDPTDVHWMSEDLTHIYDPTLRDFVPFPDDFESMKQAMVEAFKHFTKILILAENKISMEQVWRRWVPQDIWETMFTEGETVVLKWGQERAMYVAMSDSYESVVYDWYTLGRYPSIPTTRKALNYALSSVARAERINNFIGLFDPPSVQSDDWLMRFFSPYMGVLALEPIEEHVASYEERKSLVKLIAAYADTHFVLVVLEDAEGEIAYQDAELAVEQTDHGMMSLGEALEDLNYRRDGFF